MEQIKECYTRPVSLFLSLIHKIIGYVAKNYYGFESHARLGLQLTVWFALCAIPVGFLRGTLVQTNGLIIFFAIFTGSAAAQTSLLGNWPTANHLSQDMTMVKSLLSLLLAGSASMATAEVVKLNEDNYKEKTEGKTVFLKMFAPWVRRRWWGVTVRCADVSF